MPAAGLTGSEPDAKTQLPLGAAIADLVSSCFGGSGMGSIPWFAFWVCAGTFSAGLGCGMILLYAFPAASVASLLMADWRDAFGAASSSPAVVRFDLS